MSFDENQQQGGIAMSFDDFLNSDWQPLDPSGESDRIHDLRKQGLTASYDERLAAYHEVHR